MLSLWKSISALWSGQIANHRIDMSFNFVVFFFKVIVLRTFGWISTHVPYLLRQASEINSTETAPTSAQFQNLDFFFFSFNFKAYMSYLWVNTENELHCIFNLWGKKPKGTQIAKFRILFGRYTQFLFSSKFDILNWFIFIWIEFLKDFR